MDAITLGTVEGALARADTTARTEIAALLPHPPDRPSALARALYDAAVADPSVRDRLARWISAVEAVAGGGRDRDPYTAHGNTITGGAQHAGVVQAGTVRDIHWHTSAPAPVALPVPRQLMAAPRQLAGRGRDLAALEAMRHGGPRPGPLVAVVNGPAGVGKTALASYWLRGLVDDFPDGQLYADLRGHAPEGPAGPAEALGMFLRAFGLTSVPADPAEGSALWRSVTAGRRILLMLDNAVSAAQVRPLLPGAERSLVVVTSRRRLTGLALEGALFHPLGFLDDAASAEILAQRVGEGRTAAEPAAVQRVVDRCGGLALAVCVVAARMAARPGQPLAATAEALDRGAAGLTALRAGEADEEVAVQSALDASYRLLPPDAAALYRLLGVLPYAEFTVPAVAAAAQLTAADADRLIDVLAEASLLEEPGGGRHRFHDLVRLHARGLAETHDPPEARIDTVRRALEWQLATATATAAEALISPSHRTLDRDYEALSPDPAGTFAAEQDALAWLGAEQQHLMTAVRTAAGHGWHALTWQLTDAMWPLFLRLRPYDLWVEAHELGLAAARGAGHLPGELRMLTSGGAGLLNRGRPDEAVEWFGRALTLARDGGDRLVEAQALHGLGQSHHLAGRLNEAAEYFGRALRLREEIGYARGAALSRLSLGDVALSAGRPDDAVGPLTRARADLAGLPDPYEAARALALLGAAHGQAGRTDEAERFLRQAAEEFRARGSAHWEARSLELLGLALRRADRPNDALNAFERSRALYEGAGAPDADRLAARVADLSPPGAPPSGDPSPGAEPPGTS